VIRSLLIIVAFCILALSAPSALITHALAQFEDDRDDGDFESRVEDREEEEHEDESASEEDDEEELDFAEQLERAQLDLKRAEQRQKSLERLQKTPRRNARAVQAAIKKARIQTGLRRKLIDIHTYLVQLDEAGEDETLERVEAYAEVIRELFSIDEMVREAREELFELRELRDEAEEDRNTELAEEAAEVIKVHQNVAKILGELRVALGEVDEESERPERPSEEEDAAESRLEELIGGFHFQRELLELRHEILEQLIELQEAKERGRRRLVARIERELDELRTSAGLIVPADDSAESEIQPPVEVSEQDLAAAARADFDRQIMPLLKQHCIDCHGPDTAEAELNFVEEVTVRPLVRHQEVWDKVLAHVKTRVMPPEDAAEMSDGDRRRLAAYFEWAVNHFDYSRIDDPGYEGSRRLTHVEYNNTIRDLFQIDLRPADKFPTELTGTSGFDNSGNTLFLHRLQMERYFGAAEAIVEHALPRRAATETQLRSRRNVFVVEPENEASEPTAAKDIFERFLTRAYRRQPTVEESAAALRQFEQAKAAGQDFEQAVRHVVQMVLVSPGFLMRVEEWQQTDQPYPVNDWDLASRLSYFLWSSTPDDELLELAAQGRLSEPANLRAQVERLLADNRSATLGSVFAAQWLGSQHLGVRIRPDPIDNPWCTHSLMESMKAETAMFFHSLIRDDAPISQLIDADYTFLNEEVAGHYGIEGVQGADMRRVSLADHNRGGIFGQGALLAITSFPGRTSPVVRGKWVLSEVLGTPPPPPPPNVSDFSDAIAENRFLSPRQKLQMHRRNPNCYTCHSQIDPLGFSLERFDWFGRTVKRRRGKPVDDIGKLPNGTEFQGPAGLKDVIVRERLPDLVRQVARKMLSYALGRQLEYYDEPAVRKIIQAVTNDEYRFRTLVYGIVESYPFRYKKNPAGETDI